MNRRTEDYILLNMIESFGFKKLESLLTVFKEPKDIFKASKSELKAIDGIGETLADKIKSLTQSKLDEEIAAMSKKGVYAIDIFDERYPESLKNTYSPPIVFYVKGNIKIEDHDSIGIVGSRTPSAYGASMCEKLSCELSSMGLSVVSGMARGIDTIAHKAALNYGRTIAVLGSGLNNIYPPDNKRLADEITEKGALISEFPMNTPPNRFNFPRRNRVISGLSLGVLVVEASLTSGALITADFALDENREVFALPGRIDSKVSAGANKLIKEGAKLVESADDIMYEIENRLKYRKKASLKSAESLSGVELSQEEKAMKRLLSYEPIYIDKLASKSNMKIDKVSSLLVQLEIKNLIRELPGKHYILR